LKSTALGNPFAYKYLALIEEEIKDNLTKCISYLKKGCDVGDMAAMTNLAVYYRASLKIAPIFPNL
jgi:TPR repeat protein